MDFSDALQHLKWGYEVTREGWNGKGQKLAIYDPNENGDVTVSFIGIQTVQGDVVPWAASQTDLLAEDWRRVDA